jgi:GNAT superfamily N-acetyltransferase
MSTPNVRHAREDDQEAVRDLWMALLEAQAELDDRMGVAEDARDRWDNDFSVWLEDETSRIFVAETDAVVGFVSARRWGPPPIYRDEAEVFLEELYVAPDARRQGLGSALVAAVRDWADALGAHRVRLSVLAANEAGRAFWAAQNAEPMTLTLTIDCPGPDSSQDDEGTKKIGF